MKLRVININKKTVLLGMVHKPSSNLVTVAQKQPKNGHFATIGESFQIPRHQWNNGIIIHPHQSIKPGSVSFDPVNPKSTPSPTPTKVVEDKPAKKPAAKVTVKKTVAKKPAAKVTVKKAAAKKPVAKVTVKKPAAKKVSKAKAE